MHFPIIYIPKYKEYTIGRLDLPEGKREGKQQEKQKRRTQRRYNGQRQPQKKAHIIAGQTANTEADPDSIAGIKHGGNCSHNNHFANS